MLFFKRISDVHDEEYRAALAESGGDEEYARFPQNYRFQIPHECHWNDLRTVTTNVGQALQKAMRCIETANPDTLYGIFGDAQWTNKDRLSDAMLRDLIEHFSSLELTIANLPEDELGNGYEYLIKKFADDSGHTAAEFYTNRTVVHLMTEMLEPQPGETIYDPTCGSGGMLLSAIAHLRSRGLEWRNVRLYGQERNLMTSSIARMNCFLHGIEEFQIVRGDTLSAPRFVEGDRLQRFDVVLANPPYSIKQWDRSAFAADPWGRNVFGTPPQGRADYAFWQHILASMDEETGRSVRNPLPARCPLPAGGGGDAAQVDRGGPDRVRSGARAEPLLQLADGGVRGRLPDEKARGAAGQDPLHQRCQRGHPGTGAEFPHRRAYRADRRGLPGVLERGGVCVRGDASGDPGQRWKPEHPALRCAAGGDGLRGIGTVWGSIASRCIVGVAESFAEVRRSLDALFEVRR